MSLLQYIRNIFSGKRKEVYIDAEALMQKYGTDFNSFLYRPNTDVFIRKEIIPIWNPPNTHNGFFDHDHWEEKHPFNFPGPFYTGQSDSCGTGDAEAPANVLYDENTYEYIFRQPQNFAEFLAVIDAAAVEVFDSYSCNGNNHWTYEECRNWWSNKEKLLTQLRSYEVIKANGRDRAQLYIDYLNGDAETDLRKYCYFLENGVFPSADTENLPVL